MFTRAAQVDPVTSDGAGAVAGSFRDPSGFVFTSDGVIYRQVNESYRTQYDLLMASGLATDLMERKWLIRHDDVATRPVDRPAAYKVLRPERVPFISYLYEWSFSQLRDAALLTLQVQLRAMTFGMSLKDASAYNVQFVGGQPVHIDTLSFEPLVEGRPWVAYRQFCQHFLAPLALMSYRDARLNQTLRVFLDGVPLDLASRLLPWRTRFRPSLAMHLHLHARAQQRYAGRPGVPASRHPVMSRAALRAVLDSLRKAVVRLRWKPAGTEWADYYDDTNYSESAMAEKERIVSRMLQRVRPAMVWDLGANVGRFSRLASQSGIKTVAFDSDSAAVERNYVKARASRDAHLLPLVMDLTNPSANLGWGGTERLSLQQRGRADLVLALALIHHLAIGNNVPLGRIAEWLSVIGRFVAIEFVPRSDSQVQRLLASREDIFSAYSETAFEQACEPFFAIESRQPISGTERVMYLLRSR